jgi:uncharacterized protein YeaO (DUF488 family)
MFREASVYDREQPPGWRVLIMRYWPRGVRRDRIDLWLRDAAPSAELIRAYRHAGLDWAEFERRYRREITHERPAVLDQLRELDREHGEIVLLCTERIPPDEHCHRLTLIQLLSA